ncbi:hypothetical protein PVAND_011531 [Polypedilum vanderplanki]|uniref:Cytochrome P450 n=1 Tax=Polypedilum vanderplanki TaxID=319348 RepID=A0A9J6CJW4_POLVA|nr:hypothetical protein PVAND_011531 [Polypedilum vanderplanki]
MVPLTVILLYVAIASFLIYTFKNKKPLKWSEIANAIPFYQYIVKIDSEDTFKIPGPLRLPFIGTKWQNIKMNKLHEYYESLNNLYGDVVLEVCSNNVPVISLFNKNDIEKVLHFNSAYPFRPPTEILSYYRKSRPDRYASLGLINEQGPEWGRLRAKMTPKTLESRKVLSSFCSDFNELSDEFINVIKLKRNEENIVKNFEETMKLMSIEAACALILGRKMGYLADSHDHLDNNSKELMIAVKNIFGVIRDSYYGNGMWKYFPTKLYSKYIEYEDKIYDIITGIINETLHDHEFMALDSDNMSILAMILKADGLDMKDKISGVIDFLTASQVLSHTMIFLLHFLSEKPEVQEKIYQETLPYIKTLSYENIKKFHYTRAAILESLRISPTAFSVARILEQDFNFSGYHVKAGNIVLLQNMVACNKDENFENAKTFNPDRWLNENGEFNINQCSASPIVIPFGYGKRACPGKKFSEMEMTILTVKLIHSYKIEYHSTFEKQFEFLVVPKDPVDIKFTNRF